MDNFDRDFNRIRTIVIGGFIFVGVMFITTIGLYIYIATTAVTAVSDNCQDGLARCAGRVVGEFQKGVNGE